MTDLQGQWDTLINTARKIAPKMKEHREDFEEKIVKELERFEKQVFKLHNNRFQTIEGFVSCLQKFNKNAHFLKDEHPLFWSQIDKKEKVSIELLKGIVLQLRFFLDSHEGITFDFISESYKRVNSEKPKIEILKNSHSSKHEKLQNFLNDKIYLRKYEPRVMQRESGEESDLVYFDNGNLVILDKSDLKLLEDVNHNNSFFRKYKVELSEIDKAFLSFDFDSFYELLGQERRELKETSNYISKKQLFDAYLYGKLSHQSSQRLGEYRQKMRAEHVHIKELVNIAKFISEIIFDMKENNDSMIEEIEENPELISIN